MEFLCKQQRLPYFVTHKTAKKSIKKLSRKCFSCNQFIDRAILRAQARDMLGGVMLDACASVRADALCDEEERKIARDLKEGEHLTMRFSPGYGDAPLQASADVIAVLDATRHIGLAMTKRFMMTPVKSVTAIIGVSLQDTDRTRGCGTCSGRETCPYRKRGEGCGF